GTSNGASTATRAGCWPASTAATPARAGSGKASATRSPSTRDPSSTGTPSSSPEARLRAPAARPQPAGATLGDRAAAPLPGSRLPRDRDPASVTEVVSVSLGSSSRDTEQRLELLGTTVAISRRGVDGDLQA